MSRFRSFLKDHDIVQCIEEISEEQAENSDIGGDTDADDELVINISQQNIHSSLEPANSQVETNEPSTSSASNIGVSGTRLNRISTQRVGTHCNRTARGGIVRGGVRRPQVRGGIQHRLGRSQQPELFKFRRFYRKPREYKSFKFNQYVGINTEVDVSSPLKIFSIYFTVALLTNIITESNKYARQAGVDLNLTVDELQAFIGILIIMGFHQLPSIRHYWSNNNNFHVARIASIMSIKRFLKILRYIHLNDNNTMKIRGDPEYDRLHKIRPLITCLTESFKSAFKPNRFLSIDESMIAFKGRNFMKQYMPMKPTKRGFKVWVLCCAITGYMVCFEIYEGKKENETDYGLGENVVLNLSQMFAGMGFCIYFDRFFTSLILLKELLSRSIFACGTILTNKKHFPKDKLRDDKQMQMGEYDSVMDGSISVTKWKDRGKKCVTMASNMHNPGEITSVLRTNKRGEKEPIDCPKCVANYNVYMGGVDKFDQLMSSYPLAWKSRRWWLKIFYYLLDASIVNSFILYKEIATKTLPKSKCKTHLLYRNQLANELINDFVSRKRCGRRSIITNLDVSENHYPEKTTSKRCNYCSTTAKPVRSRVGCNICKISLCITCFKPYHNNNCQKRLQ